MAFSFGSNTGSSFSFGSNTASAFGSTTTAPATGGFGFGTTPAPNTGSSFGGFGFGAPAASASSSGFGGFSFGSTPATGSTFGFGTAPATTSSFGGFGFGAPATSTQQQQPAFGGFGGFGFTQPQPQQQQPQPQQPQLQPHMKLADLPEPIQKQLLDLDQFIQRQSVIRDEIANHASPLDSTTSANAAAASSAAADGLIASGTSGGSLRGSIDSISSQISALSLKIQHELSQLSAFESAVADQYREGEAAQRSVNKMLMQLYPQQQADAAARATAGGTLMGRVSSVSLPEKVFLPSRYHWTKLNEFAIAVQSLTAQLRALDEALQTSGSLNGPGSLATPQSLSRILHAHHASIVSSSARVAALHESVNHLIGRFEQLFGEEGRRRIEEERRKEKKKQQMALDVIDVGPLVSSTATNTTSTVTQTPAATTTNAAPATATAASSAATTNTGAATAPPSTTTTAPATTGFGFGGFGQTTPATTTPATTTFGSSFGTSDTATKKLTLSRSKGRR